MYVMEFQDSKVLGISGFGLGTGKMRDGFLSEAWYVLKGNYYKDIVGSVCLLWLKQLTTV
jgi:hypothetical protein